MNLQTQANPVQLLLGTPTGRRRLSRSSISFFDSHYCGMEPTEHRKKWLTKIDRARTRAKEKCRQEKILLLGPRKHGKSETAVTICTRFICEDRAVRILLIGSTAGQASKRLRRVKKLLESKRVEDDWCSGSIKDGLGPFRNRGSKWGDYSLEVVRPIEVEDHIDPTMEASGRDGAITGGHFDIIILDDVEDVKHVKNSRIRAETKEWFQEIVFPILEPDGLLLVIGTRKHRDDLYNFFMDPHMGFDVIHNRAILEEADHVEPIFEMVDGRRKLVDVKVTGGRVLWPRSDIGPESRRRGIEYIYRVKLSYPDPKLFTREWQNEVLDDEDRMFKSPWIRAGMLLGQDVSLYTGLAPRPIVFPPKHGGYRVKWPDLIVVQAWDLSLIFDEKDAEDKDSDWTVGITAGWEPATDKNWLMGIRRQRGLDPDEMEDLIIEERLRFPQYDPRRPGVPYVRAVGVEKNSFGAVYLWGLTKRMTPYGKLPLVPHTTTGSNKADPWEGVPAMKHMWKTQGVVIPSATQADNIETLPLREEFADFGVAKHDDTVLAFWIWSCIMRIVKADWIRTNRRRASPRTSVGRRRERIKGGQSSPE